MMKVYLGFYYLVFSAVIYFWTESLSFFILDSPWLYPGLFLTSLLTNIVCIFHPHRYLRCLASAVLIVLVLANSKFIGLREASLFIFVCALGVCFFSVNENLLSDTNQKVLLGLQKSVLAVFLWMGIVRFYEVFLISSREMSLSVVFEILFHLSAVLPLVFTKSIKWWGCFCILFYLAREATILPDNFYLILISSTVLVVSPLFAEALKGAQHE